MSIDSLFFLLVFLPILLVIYYLVPERFRKPVLILMSLVFCGWGNPIYILILLVSVGLNYIFALLLSEQEDTEEAEEGSYKAVRRVTFIFALLINITILLLSRYISVVLPDTIFGKLSAPIGISFYTLTVIGYLIDVWRGEDTACSLSDFAVFLLFFPKMTAGPVLHRAEFAAGRGKLNFEQVGAGLSTLIIGLTKKVFLAQLLVRMVNLLSNSGAVSVVSAWLSAVFLALEFYFDFSGYYDMATGLARMLGYRFGDNFNNPYCAGGITDFLGRWASSLTGWFRYYIFEPICGKKGRKSRGRQIGAFAVTILVAAAWHQISLLFLLWAGWMFLMFTVEHLFGEHWNGIPRILRIVVTDIGIMVAWILMLADSIPDALQQLGALIGLGGGGFFDSVAQLCMVQSIPLLIISIICYSPILKTIQSQVVFRGKGNAAILLNTLIYVALLLLCIIMLSQGAQPFIYSQF